MTNYQVRERHYDKKWVECRYPGCHRNTNSPIHSWSGNCKRCIAGGHPYWLYPIATDRYSPNVRHHFFVPPHPTFTPVMADPEGMVFD